MKVVALVERPGSRIDRVHDDHSPTDLPGRAKDDLEGADKKFGAEALPMKRRVEREFGEEDGGDVLWRSSRESSWSLPSAQQVGCEREVSDDAFGFVDEQVSPCAVAGRRCRVKCEPLVEVAMTAREPGE